MKIKFRVTMSTKTAVFARSNSSRSSIRPLSEFQLARLPLRAVGTIITLYLRVPKVWRGKKMKKKKKEWEKNCSACRWKNKCFVWVDDSLISPWKKKKKKKNAWTTYIYFYEIRTLFDSNNRRDNYRKMVKDEELIQDTRKSRVRKTKGRNAIAESYE